MIHRHHTLSICFPRLSYQEYLQSIPKLDKRPTKCHDCSVAQNTQTPTPSFQPSCKSHTTQTIHPGIPQAWSIQCRSNKTLGISQSNQFSPSYISSLQSHPVNNTTNEMDHIIMQNTVLAAADSQDTAAAQPETWHNC
jgi:hypothetical protein